MCRVHISLDDVKGIFKALSAETYDSIFDARTLKYLKSMHDLYGVEIHLFCTYRDEKYSIENVPDRYVHEFRKNLDWLKFGFHCYEEKSVYNEKDIIDFKYYFNKFQKQIKRITAQQESVTELRIHGFWGNKEIVRYLQKNGVTTLFTADDDRSSYYLDYSAEEILKTKGTYFDSQTRIKFVRSITRMENATDIVAEIQDKMELGWDTIAIFTHEWQMDCEDVRRKFEKCCALGRKIE